MQGPSTPSRLRLLIATLGAVTLGVSCAVRPPPPPGTLRDERVRGFLAVDYTDPQVCAEVAGQDQRRSLGCQCMFGTQCACFYRLRRDGDSCVVESGYWANENLTVERVREADGGVSMVSGIVDYCSPEWGCWGEDARLRPGERYEVCHREVACKAGGGGEGGSEGANGR